jgi:hypothetical protein
MAEGHPQCGMTSEKLAVGSVTQGHSHFNCKNN